MTEKYDRFAILADFKQRIIDLTDNDFVPPEVGIYDEPVRYYKMNLQWVKLFAGLLSIIEDVAYWKDATDTNYIAIQEFLKFEEGIEPLVPVFPSESCCNNYLPSAPFIAWYPQDPYNQPDYIPPDYLVPPFMVNTALEYPEALGYQATDVFVNPAALSIDPIDVATLNFPQFRVTVKGSGQVEIDLLAVAGGGQLVYKIGSPPNLADIILDSIFDEVTILDLNIDAIAVPPETDILISEEINIEVEDEETETIIYFVFVPKLDDSLTPLGFGGGLRLVGLCAFENEAFSMVEDIRFDVGSCSIQKRVDGVWTTIDGWSDFEDCFPPGGGGGGGGVAGIKATPYSFEAGANIDTISTTMVEAAASLQTHTFTYENALILAECQLSNTNAAANAFFEVRVGQAQGVRNAVNRVGGNVGEVLYTSAAFEDLATGVALDVSIFFRASANTARIGQGSRIQYTILEFADAGELGTFVQDIRVTVGRELQKQVGGVWITVDESLNDLLTTIDNQISSVVAVNNSQQTTINTHTSQITAIQGVNSAQQIVLNNHETRIDTLEDDVEQIMDIDIPQINLTLANHESRIAALEAALAGNSTWGGYKLGQITDLNLNPAGGRYSSPFSSYDSNPSTLGWIPTANNDIDVFSADAMRLGAAAFVRVGINVSNYVSGTFSARINGGQEALLLQNIGSGNNWGAWIPVLPNESANMQIEVSASTGGNTWRLRQIVYLLVNFDPFTLQPLP